MSFIWGSLACNVHKVLCSPDEWHWHYNVSGDNHNKNAMLGSKVRSKVKLVHCWNADSNSRHQVKEVIKKIPFGVSKRFPEQRAEWVLACCWWKCLLIDTGCDSWHAADCFDWSAAWWWSAEVLNGIFLLIHAKNRSFYKCKCLGRLSATEA